MRRMQRHAAGKSGCYQCAWRQDIAQCISYYHAHAEAVAYVECDAYNLAAQVHSAGVDELRQAQRAQAGAGTRAARATGCLRIRHRRGAVVALGQCQTGVYAGLRSAQRQRVAAEVSLANAMHPSRIPCCSPRHWPQCRGGTYLHYQQCKLRRPNAGHERGAGAQVGQGVAKERGAAHTAQKSVHSEDHPSSTDCNPEQLASWHGPRCAGCCEWPDAQAGSVVILRARRDRCASTLVLAICLVPSVRPRWCALWQKGNTRLQQPLK